VEQVFDVNVAPQHGIPVVAVSGEVDVATAPTLRDRLQAAVAQDHSTIVVDLGGVTFLDSTALGVLVGALKRCRDAGGDLRLVAREPRVLKVFEITGLNEVFSISDTVEKAVLG
jgi:anti-sigma B factor antagonist